MSKKQEKIKESWWNRFCHNYENNIVFMILFSFFVTVLVTLIVVSSTSYWIPQIPNCTGAPISCVDFNSHGYTLGNVFWTFLLITEAIFFVSLFWIKRKKKESIWHYTWIMKLYSLLFSLIFGVVSYVVLLPLSWVIGKFIMLLPKIVSQIPKVIILVILHVWKPALFLVSIAIIIGAWYLINAGLAKLFGSQDG